MSNIYDRIFKEDIEPIIQAFAERILKIKFEKTEEIKDKIQTTWEREGDFLKKLIYENPAQNCVLHIEFHVKDEDISPWMLLTYGMIYYQFGLPVKQFVIFVGRKKAPKMPSGTHHENCEHKFVVLNLRDFSYRLFIESEIPELVILAVLGDFEGEAAVKVIHEILKKLQSLRGDSVKLGKYLQQLEVLSKLRNLQPLTVKTIAAMPFIYDIESDLRYKQGLEKGLEKAKIEFVLKLLAAGDFKLQQIADLANVDVDFVKKVQAASKKTNPNEEKSTKNGKKN
jgi:hypothetical protein